MGDAKRKLNDVLLL